MTSFPASAPPRAAAWIVFAAGVCAALHVGKLPPAIGALQQALGMTLLEAGFLLSLVQAAGMTAGIAFGVLADAMGLRRSMLMGLALLAAASAAGAAAHGVPALLALRAIEGFGFLMAVLPAPGLIRRLVAPQRLNVMLGVWGTYMPLGAALGLLAGPLWIDAFGWRHWWAALAALTTAMALLLWRGVADAAAPEQAVPADSVMSRLRLTLGARGPWLVAMSFALYSSQWLAVIGFLPVIYAAAGVGAATTGVLTALAAAVNMLGNLGSGRLLQRGVRPPWLLATGFIVMALAATAAFAGGADIALPPALRYAAVLLFSMVGGIIPATLFALAMRVAPGEQTVSTTVGWMQQWSAFGQFVGPPLVAWLAARAGGWHWTWAATGAASLAGLLLARAIARTVPPR
ncbi:MFS transporter [Rhizobacter sp. AJA081-3]|uniref:MFS transporter n=1 Tax=Rhizobacter sp. AJA081-3 TaxID=2753607 RepID=UPI001AE08EA1|nr:MFS transporter [Rhizobacter sp. AJA081-3]QTN24142.1 MFS transporter [Rhizobacter sp. AJA081-3]